jgi:tRNA(adenine34) deaminase
MSDICLISDQIWMKEAISMARTAEVHNEVPIGCIIVMGNQIVSTGHNTTIRDNDPTAHAEMVAIRGAAKAIGNYRMPGATLYVTLEPCAMCAGAIIQARVSRVVFGAYDERYGAVDSCVDVLCHPAMNHHAKYTGGVEMLECSQILSRFFKSRR